MAAHLRSKAYIRTTTKRLINVLRASWRFGIPIDYQSIELSCFFHSHLLSGMKDRIFNSTSNLEELIEMISPFLDIDGFFSEETFFDLMKRTRLQRDKMLEQTREITAVE
jgi:hypothetical protein